MIRLEVKEDVKNVKNYFTSLKLENYVLNALEWNQKNKEFLKFISPYHHILIWEME